MQAVFDSASSFERVGGVTEVHGSLSTEDYAAAIRLDSRASGLAKLLFPTVLLALFLAFVLQPLLRGASLWFPITALLAMVAVIFILRAAPERAAKAAFRTSPMLGTPQEIAISQDGFSVRSQYGHSNLPWQVFHKRKPSDSLLLIYQGEGMFHVLPRRWFASDQQWQDFNRVVAEHVPIVPRRSSRDVLVLVLLWIVLAAGIAVAFLQGAMVR